LAPIAIHLWGILSTTAPPPQIQGGDKLIWADEFDHPLDLTTLEKLASWTSTDFWQDANIGYMDPGGGSWQINPNQHPFYSPFKIANGVLTITARKTPSAIVPDIEAVVGAGNAPKWSGGMLITNKDLRSFKYGYFEVRARWPNPGNGMFPGIWLFVADGRGLSRASGAEIDILEIMGYGQGRPWSTTLHLRDWLGGGDQVDVASVDYDTTNWHIYGLDWQPSYLRFYYDGVMIGEVTGEDASWFDVPMSIRLNFAMDGRYVKKFSDETTPEVMRMEVDYLRVYENTSSIARPKNILVVHPAF
jgi:beta-glucanase (GH16 family)